MEHIYIYRLQASPSFLFCFQMQLGTFSIKKKKSFFNMLYLGSSFQFYKSTVRKIHPMEKYHVFRFWKQNRF